MFNGLYRKSIFTRLIKQETLWWTIIFKQILSRVESHAWYLSKYDEGRGFSDGTSTLAVEEKSFRTFAILCERGKLDNIINQFNLFPKI